jgi:hypothetical protein
MKVSNIIRITTTTTTTHFAESQGPPLVSIASQKVLTPQV